MKGTSKIRGQGYDDPLLVRLMRERGFDELPLYKHRPPEQTALRRRWSELAKFRDGPINSCPIEIGDIGRATADIKRLAYDLVRMPSGSQSSPLSCFGRASIFLMIEPSA